MINTQWWTIKRYLKHTNISFPQVLLKTSLVPLKEYKKNLKKGSKVLDFGCGEGITSILLGHSREDLEVHGIDKNKRLVEMAQKIKQLNVKFFNLDLLNENFFHNDVFNNYDLIICNDVIHHFPYKYHKLIIEKLNNKLNKGGKLILKEVDKNDYFDHKLTNFFDKKLYPLDFLSFRNINDWFKLFKRLGYKENNINLIKQKHICPASRSIIILDKVEIEKINIEEKIKEKNNLAKNQGLKNVLITGTGGFIGKNLLEKLKLNNNYHLILISRSVTNIKDKNISIINSELSELTPNSVVFDNVDIVIHLASEVKYENGDNIYENNINGTKYLLRSIGQRNRDKVRKIIFTSSIGAIDRSKNDNCNKPLDLKATANPSSYYGYSKLVGEKLIRKFSKNNVILRICWCYGKYMTSDTHMKFLFESTKKNKLFSFFNFPGKVSIIHIDELINILVFFMESNKSNVTYYVNDGQPISLGKMFKEYKRHFGKKFMINIPKFVTNSFKFFRGILPFKIKTLFMDTMVADDAIIREISDIKINKFFPEDIESLNK